MPPAPQWLVVGPLLLQAPVDREDMVEKGPGMTRSGCSR